MKKSYFASRFFVRLLLLSCFMGVLPLALLGYLSYHKSASTIQEEVERSNQLILRQNRASVEYLLQTVDTLSTQLVNGPVTTNEVSMHAAMRLPYHTEHRKIFDSLKQKLIQIQVFELGIRDVNLMSFDQQWLVDNGIVYVLASLDRSRQQDAVLKQLSDQLTAYKEMRRRSFWTLAYDYGAADPVLRLVKPIPINALAPAGLLAVDIPLQEINKRLTRDARVGTLLIVNGDGTVISHGDASRIGTNLADAPYIRTIHARRDGGSAPNFTYDDGDQTYVVTYNQSAYNDWTYISMTSVERITVESRAIKGYTFFVAGCILGLVVLIAFLLSRRMYTPIQQLARFLPALDGSKRGAGDELSLIGEQLQGLVQTQHDMAHQIRGLNRQAKEYFVVKLLQGELYSGELEEQLAAYGYAAVWEQWCIFAIQIDTLEHTRFNERARDLLMFAIHNMAEEIVPASNRLSPIVMNQSVFILVGQDAGETRPFQVRTYTLAEEIQSKVKQYLGVKISIGISRFYEELHQASDACRESIDALAYRIRLGHESILFMDEVQPEARDRFKYPKELERGLFEAVKQQQAELAATCLEQLVAQLLDKNVSHLDSQFFLGRLHANLIGLVHDEGGSIQDVFSAGGTGIAELQRQNSPEEIQDWFRRKVLQPLMAWLDVRRRSREVSISEAVMTMIREEYDEDLTIELCAARLHFNANYISRVFKKEMGTTFSNVLSRHRMSVAKRWLQETDMKIAEIAGRLRYSHTSNFIRNFKKSEGVTPSQYRDRQT
ncbi:helix-turn-helix domain-containing protein [Paenibacillus sp. IB182496]|uniref:Helix-turn-helix domain-containing protein n=1 Tax=Paenibacillus sabuli TaxID=2772509 RepID=A0A927BTM5_9BACL|nr:AraC family transcriptional regulator [Paenibacillus sabuli]MBD2845555.1 helix-turn-helix domain-containing protein [Paenibacillus sabuli]